MKPQKWDLVSLQKDQQTECFPGNTAPRYQKFCKVQENGLLFLDEKMKTDAILNPTTKADYTTIKTSLKRWKK